MTPSTPRRGKLELAVDLELDSLRLLARGLPGIDTVPTADGLFTLDHIPDEVEARIIVHGLPDDCAQEAARTSRDGLALVRVVAGATVEG